MQNHIVERMWSEINVRVNYLIKSILVDLVDKGEINPDYSLHYFCISWLCTRVSFVGIELFIKSWNNHPIPGKLNCECENIKTMLIIAGYRVHLP